MQEWCLTQALDRLYAAFGKPAPTGRILDAIFDQVRDYPDGFASWAADRLMDEEKLPNNMGRAMRIVYPDWMQTQAATTPARDPFAPIGDPNCPMCHGSGELHCWQMLWDNADGYWRMPPPGTSPITLYCHCRTDLARIEADPILSRIPVVHSYEEADRHGITFLDPWNLANPDKVERGRRLAARRFAEHFPGDPAIERQGRSG